MQITRFLSLVAVAAIFGAGGYFLGRQSEPSAAGTSVLPAKNAGSTKAPPAPVPSGMLSDSLAKLRGGDPLTAANAPALTFRALEESDPVTRMAATTLLLESMTPENALAIRQAFLDITAQTGRRADGEWALMVRRCGTVLGAEALKHFASDKNNLALAIEGFAFANPDGALAACKAAGLEGKPVTNAWLTGVCRKDPNKAITLALSGKYEGINAGGLLNQTIQNAGVEGAREAMQRALDADPDKAPSSTAFPGMFNALADALLHKNLTANTPGEMFKWLEAQKGQPYLSDDLVNRTAFKTMMNGNTAETLAWLERMNAGTVGPPVGNARFFEAVTANPKILTDMDDASFARFLPLMEKDPLKLLNYATQLEKVSPERASRIRALIPVPAIPAPPVPAASPSPPPGGQ